MLNEFRLYESSESRVISKAQATESSLRNQKTKRKQFAERARKSERSDASPRFLVNNSILQCLAIDLFARNQEIEFDDAFTIY